MKIAILGYGLQGKSSFEYWNKGNEVTICDQNKIDNAPFNAKLKTGENYLRDLAEFDLIVRSPSIYPKDIVSSNDESILDKVTTNTNEFFKVCPSKNIIGVTGTKGKGTTSTLITKMLEADGKTVHLGGNIGTPPLEMLKSGIKSDDWVILELANFQLIDIKYSPHIAVCLMVSEEHLDWHSNMDDYINAKKQLFIHQKPDDIAIFLGNNPISESIVNVSQGKKIPYLGRLGANVIGNEIDIEGNKICGFNDIKLIGVHNQENICAAITAAWQITQNQKALLSAIRAFTGLPHRLEIIKSSNNITYYNDSFASAPEATLAAINSITNNKIMIIGGLDRNLNLDNLAIGIKQNSFAIRKVVLIGQSASRVAAQLDNIGYTNYEICTAKTMEEIVDKAKSLALPGDSIVLSPGFPSFDMFRNFEERGEKFRQVVTSL